MNSSTIPNDSINSRESPTSSPELEREKDRLKLLLDMTNTLVSNFHPPSIASLPNWKLRSSELSRNALAIFIDTRKARLPTFA